MERKATVGLSDRLGEALIEGAFLRREQLEQAQAISRDTGKRLQEVLLENQWVTPDTIATVLSFQFNIPVVELRQFQVQPEALRRVPADLARQYHLLPLAVEADTLRVAMEDPLDMNAQDVIAAATGMRIKAVMPLRGGVREMIESHYKATAKIEQELRQAAVEERRPTAVPMLEAEAVAKAPVVRAVDMIVSQAVKDRASDIHIMPRKEEVEVLYRIDGVLHKAVSLPKGVDQSILSRIKVLANMNIAERRRPQDGGFSLTLDQRDINFRVATAETQFGEMAVIRVLDKSVSVLKLADLGFQPTTLRDLESALNAPFGMIMVSGPTGSGKTTTLYACLNMLVGKGRNIMTIEDPVEYHFEQINQIQVNRAADITFAAGLRAIMRMDPDIILVGEIRDAETANVAVQAALTGHLVLTSIHANDSASAIVRLINMGVEPFLVTSAVIGSLAQRLVRKVCTYCRTLAPVSPVEAMAYRDEMQEARSDFYTGRGDNFCSQTGFLGRIGAFEFLLVKDQVRQLIARNAPANEIKQQAIKDGLVTLRRDGMLKARDGLTTPAEVMRNVYTIE